MVALRLRPRQRRSGFRLMVEFRDGSSAYEGRDSMMARKKLTILTGILLSVAMLFGVLTPMASAQGATEYWRRRLLE